MDLVQHFNSRFQYLFDYHHSQSLAYQLYQTDPISMISAIDYLENHLIVQKMHMFQHQLFAPFREGDNHKIKQVQQLRHEHNHTKCFPDVQNNRTLAVSSGTGHLGLVFLFCTLGSESTVFTRCLYKPQMAFLLVHVKVECQLLDPEVGVSLAMKIIIREFSSCQTLTSHPFW